MKIKTLEMAESEVIEHLKNGWNESYIPVPIYPQISSLSTVDFDQSTVDTLEIWR